MEYKPIRILKDVQVTVRSRAYAELHYPHGEVKSVPVHDATIRMPGYTVYYYHPMRINVPTEREKWLCNTEYAAYIPQHKNLNCDDPNSKLSGSRGKTTRHRRQAGKEMQKRQDRIPELEELIEKEVIPKKPEPELKEPPKRIYSSRSDSSEKKTRRTIRPKGPKNKPSDLNTIDTEKKLTKEKSDV